MELVQVRIKRLVITQRYGTLSSNDLLRTDAAFARHLVEDCAAAKYLIVIDNAIETPDLPSKTKRRAKKEAAG